MGQDRTRAVLFRATFSEGGYGSHDLLLRAAQRYSGLDDAALGELETAPRGKPFFSRAPGLHFSLTHSGQWWLCAFAPVPLGLDLQIHRSHTDPAKLSRRFFHPREDAWLARNGYRDFFDLWCAKESWVKYTGHGFFDDPATFSVVDERGNFPSLDGAQLRLLPFAPGYSLCLCAREEMAVERLDL